MAYGNGGTTVGHFEGAATASQRRPIILGQMQVLDERTETLNQLVAELEARVSAVLQPEPPAVKHPTDTPGSPVPNVALGANIAQVNDRLGMLAQRVRSIIDRVEV